MFTVMVAVVLLVLGGVFMAFPPSGMAAWMGRTAGVFLVLFGILAALSLSFVFVGEREIATLTRVYGGQALPAGQILGLPGQRGPQARILGPGLNFEFLINWFYDVDTHPVLVVPEGQYGILVAQDGASLRPDQYLADAWGEGNFDKMLDAEYFLRNNGQKGPQFEVLRPGTYRINPLLWKVNMAGAVDVPTGHVAVIRSNVQTEPDSVCDVQAEEASAGETGGNVSTPIVPRGCIGVWDEPLTPNRYYLNNMAYVHTIIPTRLETLRYQGGYTKRSIELEVDADGNLAQNFPEEVIAVPNGAADEAVTVRVDGWEFPVEVRAVIQVHPEDAPIVVASVGDLTKVENNIITPTIRDILRTIGGAEDREPMDFVEKRDQIIELAEEVVAREARKAGVTLQELRLGEAAIPPELMVATLREQLATQLQDTYVEEQEAQQARIAVEEERARADQQSVLVAAQIARQAAEERKAQLRFEGEGERDRLMAIAEGQRDQAAVLGEDTVAQLRMFEMALDAAVENPAIVKVPMVNVTGADGGGLAGAAAVFGAASNLVNTTAAQAFGHNPSGPGDR